MAAKPVQPMLPLSAQCMGAPPYPEDKGHEDTKLRCGCGIGDRSDDHRGMRLSVVTHEAQAPPAVVCDGSPTWCVVAKSDLDATHLGYVFVDDQMGGLVLSGQTARLPGAQVHQVKFCAYYDIREKKDLECSTPIASLSSANTPFVLKSLEILPLYGSGNPASTAPSSPRAAALHIQWPLLCHLNCKSIGEPTGIGRRCEASCASPSPFPVAEIKENRIAETEVLESSAASEEAGSGAVVKFSEMTDDRSACGVCVISEIG